MTEADEERFLAFLLEHADVRLSVSFAPTREALWVQSFVPDECVFRFWNTAFEWSPVYAQVTGDTTGRRRGWYFMQDAHMAPVLEDIRHGLGESGQHGRVYWSKTVSPSYAPAYDVTELDRWYSKVVRWVRKHGKQRTRQAYETYFLPDAWSRLGMRS